MKRRKICAVTGSRAEYGLLARLLQKIQADPELELALVVTGAHLSPAFGLTIQEIENDGMTIARTCDILLSSDTPVGITKSMGVAMIGFSDIFEDLKPDLLLVLGDRFEIFCAASAAFMAGIPVAHLHGGETTEGALDEGLRHAITKMSRLHFTSTEPYRQRVIQLGEDPDSVFNVGALGVENIFHLRFPSKPDLEKTLGFLFEAPCIITTYHPETIGTDDTLSDARQLLQAIEGFEGLRVVFTGANADAQGRSLNKLIRDFVSNHPDRMVFFESMGQLNYLGAVRFVSALVGNSSSGIIEGPSLNVPTVNIGNRQRGRVRAASVIDCPAEKDAITEALERALSIEFQSLVSDCENPYAQPDTAGRILAILKTADLKPYFGKSFYDVVSVSPTKVNPHE